MDDQEIGDLVRAAGAGSADAWSALVTRFSGLVWAVARRCRLNDADAGDVFQTTWLRLAEGLHRIEQPERVGAWLATTARREALRVASSSARTVPTGDERLLDRPEEDDSPERLALDREQSRLDRTRDRTLWRAFRVLPDRCQGLLRLLMADPAPNYAEVSAALDLPVGSIGPTRRRCLDHLRRQLVDSGITGAVTSP